MATEWGEWLVCYAGYRCPKCGRFRMMRNANGMEVCEKCEWCPQLGMFVILEECNPAEQEDLYND